jgi:hypothetical protein
MMFCSRHVMVGALVLMAASCSDHNSVAPVSVTTVRLVNDTDIPLSLASNGVVASTDAEIAFSQASTCVSSVLPNTLPVVTITDLATRERIPFTTPLVVGDNLIIVAFNDAAGNLRLAVLGDGFTPFETGAGLRFFNGIPNVGPLQMQRRGFLTEFVEFGAASALVNVLPDSAVVTFADQFSNVVDAGPLAFPRGTNWTVFLGPAVAGIEDFRFFTVQDCERPFVQ